MQKRNLLESAALDRMFNQVFQFASARQIIISQGLDDNSVTDPRVEFRGPLKGAITYAGVVLMPNLNAQNNRNVQTLMALLHEVMHVFVGACPQGSNEDAILGAESVFIQQASAGDKQGPLRTEWNEAFRAWNTGFTAEFIERYLGNDDPYDRDYHEWTEFGALTDEGQAAMLQEAVDVCFEVYPGVLVKSPDGVKIGGSVGPGIGRLIRSWNSRV